MEIKWDKAPEGATHYYKNSPQPWRNLSGPVWQYYSYGVWHSAPSGSTSARLLKSLGKELFAKPNLDQINEQARSDAIDKLADEIAEFHGVRGARVTHQDLALHLYELNYRRFEILDDAP